MSHWEVIFIDSSGLSFSHWVESIVIAQSDANRFISSSNRESLAAITQHGWLCQNPLGGKSWERATTFPISPTSAWAKQGCHATYPSTCPVSRSIRRRFWPL